MAMGCVSVLIKIRIKFYTGTSSQNSIEHHQTYTWNGNDNFIFLKGNSFEESKKIYGRKL